MTFKVGQSGNPGGRPKEAAEVKALARTHCKAAVEELARLMASTDEKTRLAACNAMLDRGIGKPAQVVIGDSDEDPIKLDGVLRLVKSTVQLAIGDDEPLPAAPVRVTLKPQGGEGA